MKGAALPNAPLRATTIGTLAPQHREALCNTLNELQALLLCSDLRALEVHSALQANKTVVTMGGFDALSQSIANFDFAIAATQCQELMLALRSDRQGLSQQSVHEE